MKLRIIGTFISKIPTHAYGYHYTLEKGVESKI